MVEFFQHAGDDDLPVRARVHVWPDAQANAAFLRHFLGHDVIDDRHNRLVGLF